MPNTQPPSLRGALAVAGAALACLLAPAAAGAKIYYSAFPAEGGTAIERAAFDGGSAQTLHRDPAGFEDGVALDMAAGKVYWTDTAASVIARANLAGGEAEIVVDDLGWEPLGVAIDPAHGALYWNDKQGVKRATLDGAQQELLVKGATTGLMTLDLSAQQMYWVVGGTIRRAPMEASPAVEEVLSGLSAPFGLAVDHAAGKLFWLGLGKKTQIRRANLDGSEVETIAERPGAGFEGGLAVDAAAGRLYWTEAAAHDIATAALDGSGAHTLFATGQDQPIGLAVETLEPRPVNTAAPALEGAAQAGEPLTCNPGSWNGIGPVSLGYRWLAGGAPVEGVAGPVYVPSSEQAGGAIACEVTASDNVEASSARSAAATVAAAAATPQQPQGAAPAATLVAGIAASRLAASATRVRVPLFSSLECTATLLAVPLPAAASRRHRAPRAHARRRPLSARGTILPGRSTLTLKGLQRGVSYRIVLVAVSADGQTVRDSAALQIRRR